MRCSKAWLQKVTQWQIHQYRFKYGNGTVSPVVLRARINKLEKHNCEYDKLLRQIAKITGKDPTAIMTCHKCKYHI